MNISLSVNDLLACCGFLCGQGCNGGYPISAWRYFKHHGVVTGECDPYFDNTGCYHPGCEPAYPTPKCVRKCVSGNQVWRESKQYGVSAYKVRHDPQDIMADVYKNGPVEVAFTVYEDFAHYKYGMYKHITGDNIGGHAVKLIGWGTSDDGEDYWLLANQWNRSWGDLMETNIMRSLMGCTSFTPSVLIQKGAIIPRRCIRHLCLRTAESARGSSSDAAMAIDKQKVAVDILHEIRTEVSRMKESIGMVPGLAVLHVGDTKLSTPYWAPCGFVGIRSFEVHLAEDTTEEKTLECVSSFNDDPCVHGILVELPLPTHMDEHKILNAVSIEKDIKGFHPLNIGLLAMRGREPFFLPQTPKACIELLHRNNIEIKGKRAVVIGRSNTFGMPAALLLQREDATVTIIHSKTKNPQDITRQADIIISVVGKPNMVRGSWIKPGAVILDVGISFVRDRNAPDGFRWVGDICYEEACEVASAIITDVGGDGLLESDMLLSNTLTSPKRIHNFL